MTRRDQDDIAFLANEVGTTTADEILSIAEDVIGREQLAPKSQFIIQELFPALIEPPPAGGAPEPSDGVPSG